MKYLKSHNLSRTCHEPRHIAVQKTIFCCNECLLCTHITNGCWQMTKASLVRVKRHWVSHIERGPSLGENGSLHLAHADTMYLYWRWLVSRNCQMANPCASDFYPKFSYCLVPTHDSQKVLTYGEVPLIGVKKS